MIVSFRLGAEGGIQISDGPIPFEELPFWKGEKSKPDGDTDKVCYFVCKSALYHPLHYRSMPGVY
jgi:hypothetical protein